MERDRVEYRLAAFLLTPQPPHRHLLYVGAWQEWCEELSARTAELCEGHLTRLTRMKLVSDVGNIVTFASASGHVCQVRGLRPDLLVIDELASGTDIAIEAKYRVRP